MYDYGHIMILKHNKKGELNLYMSTVELENNYSIPLEYMQQAVEGSIEHFTFDRNITEAGIDMWCNDIGKIIGMEPTCAFVEEITEDAKDLNVVELICGPIMFCSRDAEGYSLLLDLKQIDLIQRLFIRQAELDDGTKVAVVKA